MTLMLMAAVMVSVSFKHGPPRYLHIGLCTRLLLAHAANNELGECNEQNSLGQAGHYDSKELKLAARAQSLELEDLERFETIACCSGPVAGVSQ